jgi:hypothetical protein
MWYPELARQCQAFPDTTTSLDDSGDVGRSWPVVCPLCPPDLHRERLPLNQFEAIVTHEPRHSPAIETHIVKASPSEHSLNGSDASIAKQHERFCRARALANLKGLPWFHSCFTAFQRSDAVRVVSD